MGVSPIGSLPFKYSHFPLPWENKLLLIPINFTPKTSHCCLKKWYTKTLGFPLPWLWEKEYPPKISLKIPSNPKHFSVFMPSVNKPWKSARQWISASCKIAVAILDLRLPWRQWSEAVTLLFCLTLNPLLHYPRDLLLQVLGYVLRTGRLKTPFHQGQWLYWFLTSCTNWINLRPDISMVMASWHRLKVFGSQMEQTCRKKSTWLNKRSRASEMDVNPVSLLNDNLS